MKKIIATALLTASGASGFGLLIVGAWIAGYNRMLF